MRRPSSTGVLPVMPTTRSSGSKSRDTSVNAANSRSIGTACRSRAWSARRPSLASSSSASRVASRGLRTRSTAPLWMIARWKRPLASGIASSVETLRPPPDSPNTVTRPGSPPNASMLSRTHARAATMSSMPAQPDAANSPPASSARYADPKMLRRWLMVTTTTSLRLHRLTPS